MISCWGCHYGELIGHYLLYDSSDRFIPELCVWFSILILLLLFLQFSLFFVYNTSYGTVKFSSIVMVPNGVGMVPPCGMISCSLE